ncbi:MAG: trypsin-like peptidase domain-containing protein [Alphaproteobacteria bacterium]
MTTTIVRAAGVSSRKPASGMQRLATVAACLLLLAAGFAPQAMSQDRGPRSVADLAEKLTDSVVNISTTQTVKGSQGIPLPKVPKGSPFEDFFEDFFNRQQPQGRPRRVNSLGSGFVIDGSGLIVTNNHVIDGADEIFVNFSDDTKLKVEKVIGTDSKTDIALLKVTPEKPLKALQFGNSAKMRVGDWVMAIGNPFGLGGTVTLGIISAKKRDINSGPYDEFIKSDAAINRGNSGGPLFDMDGRVIGVNTAIISPTGGSIGIGFAVPSNTGLVARTPIGKAAEVVVLRNDKKLTLKVTIGRLPESKEEAEQEKEEAPEPEKTTLLGLAISPMTDEVRAKYEIERDVNGLVVTEVNPDSDAARKNISEGNVIVEVKGTKVASPDDVKKEVEAAKKSGRKSVLLLIADPKGDLRFVAVSVAE